MQIIDIIIIDDDKKYCQLLASAFRAIGESMDYDIKLNDFQNLNDGIAELSNNSQYKAVILDGKCRIEAGGREDYGFLPLALNQLWDLNRQTGRHYIPFAVCTGYYDRYQDHKRLVEEKGGGMFDKSIQEEDMLIWLLKEIEKALETKFEKEFPDIFEVFAKGYLPDEQRKKLVEILKNKDTEAQISTTLASLRVFQENIYKILEVNGKIKINNSCKTFSDRNEQLSGNFAHSTPYKGTPIIYQTKTIEHLANAIFKIGSAYGNHVSPKPTNKTVLYWENPSIYVTQSLVFALLEQILWFKKLMEQP